MRHKQKKNWKLGLSGRHRMFCLKCKQLMAYLGDSRRAWCVVVRCPNFHKEFTPKPRPADVRV